MNLEGMGKSIREYSRQESRKSRDKYIKRYKKKYPYKVELPFKLAVNYIRPEAVQETLDFDFAAVGLKEEDKYLYLFKEGSHAEYFRDLVRRIKRAVENK